MTKTTWKTASTFAAVLMVQGLSLAADQAPAADRGAGASPAADREGAAREGAAREGAAGEAAQPAGGRREAANANMDQRFVQFAAASNLYEIALGNLAQERAQSDEVKAFAKQMVADHTQASQQLQQVAQKANIEVPKEMDKVHQAKLEHMRELRGQEFERGYVIDQTAGHVKAVLKFRDASTMAQNQDLKSFATTTLPKLQQHLQHASKLSGWQGMGEAQPAGATERGTGAPGRDTGATDRPGAGTGTGTGGTGTGTGGTGTGGTGGGTGTPRNQ